MAVSKLPTGKWLCQCFPYGRDGKRIRKQFATRGEALSYERRLMADKKGIDTTTSNITLKDLVQRWYDMHGKTLSSGDSRYTKLLAICERLGDPFAIDVDKNMFAVYRERRLKGEWNPKGKAVLKEATVNREYSYLRAVFSELKRMGEWDKENPLDGIRQFKEGDQELAFLYPDEIKRLLVTCDESDNKDLGIIVRLCLATGARWGEAQDLRQSQILPNRVTFTRTKGNKNRTVPISEKMRSLLPKKRGALFTPAYESFKYAIKRAGIELPSGQLTHVLRHSFASHFMMNGGNILVLQQILGHSTITMTMRYAHFAPDHLDAAVTLNPFDSLEIDK
ncbi:tyrosine-type recombinase/integrase [Pectobacterium carotovorum]|uniref:phage integrase n=1 Tax=Pectobacterium carotovorum TaxID=554 RepID=UPI0015DEE2C3|nr:tyrosine-type recombinase/integrase [Pectobacterium carotovorum]MBA0180359.1 tyrosine-type recombinase/integrase [Pectobacterium carotovorum]MCA6974449.1 tyrosine-type recombinase/integrase [Pectobacterium carotovorum]